MKKLLPIAASALRFASSYAQEVELPAPATDYRIGPIVNDAVSIKSTGVHKRRRYNCFISCWDTVGK